MPHDGLSSAERIDIAFGVNDAYVPHAAALIAAIVENAPGARFRFIVLHDGVPAQRRAQTESVAPDAHFVWREVGDDDVPAFVDHQHFNRTILFRLGLDRLAPEDCRRLIYLDVDTIVLGDVRELHGFDLGGLSIAAAPDSYCDPAAFAQRWNLPASKPAYFNSGVLVIDLERVRAEGDFAAAMAFAAEHDTALTYNDQDALNWRFWGRWGRLPPRWNAQKNMVLSWFSTELAAEMQFHERLPSLIHFNGPDKPWSDITKPKTDAHFHPWTWVYWRALARTPFAKEVAAAAKVGPIERLRLWMRWQRRRPRVLAADAMNAQFAL